MTTFETSQTPFINTNNDQKQDESVSSNSDETDNEIPYHARVYARPFTYGKLPKDFKKSDLNHVPLEDVPDSTAAAYRQVPMLTPCSSSDFNGLFDFPSWAIRPSPMLPPSYITDFNRDGLDELINLPKTEENMIPALPPRDATEFNHRYFEDSIDIRAAMKPSPVLPPSPSMLRKNARPSISPSRPVLRKTPSRQEFEEMLRERREQSLREQNVALKEAQNASIQKDLDELQEKLNKKALLKSTEQEIKINANDNPCREIVKLVETIDLPDEKVADDRVCQSNAIVEAPSKYEPALITADRKRPETPAFPVWSKSPLEDRSISPYPMVTPNSPVLQRDNPPAPIRHERKKSPLPLSALPSSINQTKPIARHISETEHDVAPHLVKFARDSSQFWYKPYITREEALALLRQAPPGTFIIRNSTTYKNAFGLVIRVAKPPQSIPHSKNSGNNEVLVRHFLLEPTTRGVRLKGCINEPTFTSLSALVYQHSINPLALPCKLIIPTRDLQISSEDAELLQSQKQLLDQGAACNVLYLFCMNMESLTGDEAIRKAVHEMYAQPELRAPIEVHFKVSQNGITLTDNKRRLFFRRHYATCNISHVGLDPDSRFFSVMVNDEGQQRAVNKTIFAYVARPSSGTRDNECHVFCDLSGTQPASAIVSFAHKMLLLNLNAKMV